MNRHAEPVSKGEVASQFADLAENGPKSGRFAFTHSRNFHPLTCLCRIEMSYMTVIIHAIFMAIGAAT